MNGSEWVTVIPAEGELAQTARELIDLAGDPVLVRTDGNGNEFRVPASIAQVWHEVRTAQVAVQVSESKPEPVQVSKPVQRRGRAPRVSTEE